MNDAGDPIPFDQYQRYGVAALAINALRKNGQRFTILEVGANTHKLLERLLPNDEIVYLDREIPEELQGREEFVLGDATELTLPDASFDVVVALDVFEHIPKERREAFLRHTSRVARALTVIGAPFDFPYVVQAELNASTYWNHLFDAPYRWLDEHAQNGLPDLDWTERTLASMGYAVATLKHGDIRLWEDSIKAHFANVYVPSLGPVVALCDRYYMDHLFMRDFSPSESYRQFVFCSRDPDAVSLVKTSFDRRQCTVVDQIWNEFPVQLLRFLPSVADEVSERDRQIAERNELIKMMASSRSWRLTRPLRFLRRQARRLLKSIRRQARNGQIFRNLNMAKKQGIPTTNSAGALQSMRKLKRLIQIGKDLPKLLRLTGGVLAGVRKTVTVFKREGVRGIRVRLVSHGNDYVSWVHRYDVLTDEMRSAMRTRIDAFSHQPLISVVMPTYNPNPDWLIAAIESVRTQIYPRWELCIADDASTHAAVRPILESYAKKDSRIKIVFRAQNGHISAASNSALGRASGEWVALMDHDDLLSEHALFWVADAINRNPEAGLIYSDEDKIDEEGKRSEPNFKCDWNVDLFHSYNMISHLGVYRTDLVSEVGGFRVGFEGSQDYDLALRCAERLGPNQIHHIPRVLYHWRKHVESTAHAVGAKSYAVLAGERALNEHFARQNVNARAEWEQPGYRIRYALPEIPPMVSLIIPTRNGLHLVKQCVQSILDKTTYPDYEILIVDNGSDDPSILEYFDELQGDARIRVVRDERPFNYSALNNAAVKLARGEVIGLLNNDVEVIAPEWLSEMVSLALQPGVGAVGARLWYPNDTLQHGGVIMIGGVAGHAHKYLPRQSRGYAGRASVIQGFSAVTAACMVIRKTIYEDVGGLNETDLKVAFNDVDFCLRVGEAGYRNVWTPYAELYHHESASRGYEDTPEKRARFERETEFMKRRWGDLLSNDPAYSPNLTLNHEDFSLAWPPRINTL